MNLNRSHGDDLFIFDNNRTSCVYIRRVKKSNQKLGRHLNKSTGDIDPKIFRRRSREVADP